MGRILVWCLAVAGWASVSVAVAPLQVVATTSMVADLVERVGGDRVNVQALMGAGVDPHLYKATASDVSKLQRADVVFYNGLLLEGKMTDVFNRMRRMGRHVYAVAADLPHDDLLHPADAPGHPDPHIWFDTALWARCIDAVVAGLIRADEDGAEVYRSQGVQAKAHLEVLHQWALTKASDLPAAKRILVTSHDAYSYFGRAYGFQVIGLQGISTVSEAALADMATLVDFIKSHGVKAVFVESSVPHATIERIATDAQVRIGGELFSDAMGTPGQIENGYDLGTYEGMVKHNLTTIVEALR
ncbi:MAG: zinc ABC transporter substrate-binding protein [Candidatus Synoicihabitans palmerolidicus]|nr:zinc ABC transporter substrate-binding protein [Candidatus Synoicihabitans palmerolidicus]